MRFLVDDALSPRLAEALRNAGRDAVHVRDYQMERATDTAVFQRAAQEHRVIVSADTDFGTLLALRSVKHPSVTLFRQLSRRRPIDQADLLLRQLPTIQDVLARGSIVVFEESRVRIRKLPIRWRDDGA